MPSPSHKRAISIAGASGGFTDRVAAVSRLAADPAIDAIVGDWLSENVMTGYGASKAARNAAEKELGRPMTYEEKIQHPCFASTFLECFEPAIEALQRNGAKLVVNAGANDSEVLAERVRRGCVERGWTGVRVAWVEGDEVMEQLREMQENGDDGQEHKHEFRNLCTGQKLVDWPHTPVSAQAYLGAMGITEALKQGTDIVVCGRVSDAAPTVGLSAWWHGWEADEWDKLAGALVAGHLIECSAFVTGGYWSGFKELMRKGRHLNLGFPVVEVEDDGTCVVTKEENAGGIVNISTVASQLVYEISGPYYYNSDVVACLTHVSAVQLAPNRVGISGITGSPPPPTTRVGITAHGGFQAEWHFYLVGLDMEEKVRWMEQQARYAIGEEMIGQMTCLRFGLSGYVDLGMEEGVGGGVRQERATADFRIFAQARGREVFEGTEGFARKLYETVLQSCPGVSRSNDLRQSTPKPYFEYFVTLIPQSACRHRVHFLYPSPMSPSSSFLPSLSIPLPPQTAPYAPQPSSNTLSPIPLENFGPTVPAPLGSIVYARSGDKASDANIGFFVRSDQEFDWLRSFLSIERLRELLGSDLEGKREVGIERCEMKGVNAVHFLLKDWLDRGYNSTSGIDTLAKNLGEWCRARRVDVPRKFLEEGWI
ncbi:hypothetical protein BCR34DRAFT_486476 [Clohesyomyces aquaticus]|uniref:DUF1446-domain-containing protein n=1 Tax=Clohesyomyces aquaticus TaxID=1231657 RepID=A0A1Y1ZIB2_9PLEO|nr:hypothetical protein BCR34DRAFT_486476 [Clohesyomyces aquaticus]